MILHVESGPLAYFGPTTIEGCTSVNERFIRKKITWRPGEKFNPCKVSETVDALEAAHLFSSINVTHADELDADGTLPMTIQLAEGKHRTIGLGLSLNTERGFKGGAEIGGMLEWEHRNFFRRGEKLTLNLNIWRQTRRGSLIYRIPDFCRRYQDFILAFDYNYDKTKGYTEESYSVSPLIERQLSCQVRVSYGLMYKWLQTRRSDNDGTFNLFKTPYHFYWNNTNDLLDPTSGTTFSFKMEPTVQMTSPAFVYWTNKVIGTAYYPVTRRFTLAGKVTFGTIQGATRRAIPASERFYAGSENTMRGYRYMTVSPFDDPKDPNKPTGGRSMLISSLEARMRFGEKFGGVLFTDIGNVYRDHWPQLDDNLLASLGVGIRYFTPVGPLRLDVAFPLNRRRDPGKPKKFFDSPFQIYLSIGQAF